MKPVELSITGSLLTYQDGKYIPLVVMAMSLALSERNKGSYFTSIRFGRMDDDIDGYFVEFSAAIQSSVTSGSSIHGSIHLNNMSKDPANCVSFK